MFLRRLFLRPQRGCGQGYVFTRVCDSVHRGGLRRPPWDQADTPPGPGRTPLTRENPPDQADTPPDQGEPPRTKQTPPTRENPPWQGDPPGPGRPSPGPDRPPGRENPPRDQADPPGPGRPPWQGEPPSPPPEEDCSIQSMSGRYASYWNAFLLCM